MSGDPHEPDVDYLAAGQGSPAAAQFQKILDHRGIVWNCWTGALAHLGLARDYALQGDTAKARAAYNDFFTLWKDADPCANRSELRQTEIQNLCLPTRRDENIRRLDVPVNDTLGASGIQPICNLNRQLQHFLQWQRLFFDPVLEGVALHQFHGDEGLAVVLADLVDGADVRMVQRRGSASLALEAFESLTVVR
jgi:hypothetical protein